MVIFPDYESGLLSGSTLPRQEQQAATPYDLWALESRLMAALNAQSERLATALTESVSSYMERLLAEAKDAIVLSRSDCLTLKQAGAYCGLSRSTLRGHIHAGRLKAYDVARRKEEEEDSDAVKRTTRPRWRILRQDLIDFIKGRQVLATLAVEKASAGKKGMKK